MIKILAILFFLSLTFQQTAVLAESGSSTQLLLEKQLTPTETTNYFSTSPSSAVDNMIKTTVQPSNWDFLNDTSLGGSAKWVTPDGTQKFYSIGKLVNYTFRFSVDCPHQTAVMRISATGAYLITLNGKWISSFLGVPYPNVHSITFSPNNFVCGKNNLSVAVLNYKFQSPSALTYRLTQETADCYDCYQERGHSFFNKNTCKCQCNGPSTCSSVLKQWLEYPFCKCQCAQPPCPSGYIQDPSSCKCLKQCTQKQACKEDQVWSESLCSCVSKCGDLNTQCSGGLKWDSINCKCRCENKVCSSSQVFNQSTCDCQCSKDASCSGGKNWNSSSCQCQCPKIVCNRGYYQDQATCQCASLSLEAIFSLGNSP